MKEVLYVIDDDLRDRMREFETAAAGVNYSFSDEHAYLQTLLLIQIARDLKQNGSGEVLTYKHGNRVHFLGHQIINTRDEEVAARRNV